MRKKFVTVLACIIPVPVLLLTALCIYHQIRLKKERSIINHTLGQFVEVDGHNMNIYTEGSGNKTLVFLSGFGTPSPILDFKPLYSRLSDKYRIVVIEKFGSLDIRLMYIGAKNNVFNSLVEFFAKMGQGTLFGLTPLVNDTACGPDFYAEAAATGHYVELDPSLPIEEIKRYVEDMDVLYTDTWLDMEFFNDPAYQERKAELMKKMMPYQLNADFIGESKAIVLHDMPMHVGFEISEEIEKKHMEHILDQAENRRHAEKAVMYTLLKS